MQTVRLDKFLLGLKPVFQIVTGWAAGGLPELVGPFGHLFTAEFRVGLSFTLHIGSCVNVHGLLAHEIIWFCLR